jgi:acetyl esterase/lipase
MDAARRTLNRGIFLRSTLGAIAVVVALLPLVVDLGAYAPRMPALGRFGGLVVIDLPALLLEATVAAAAAVIALALGGGRWTRALVAMTGASLAMMIVSALVMTVFAGQLDVSFDLLRMAQPSTATVEPDEHVVFATIEGVDLHAEIWRAQPLGTLRPAVVYVHGGAFYSGGLGSRRELFGTLAAGGTTVIDIEYRLSPPPRWVDAPSDVLCGIGWVGSHADDLGIDATKIVLAGESAGGNLAMLAGYVAGTDALQPSCAGSRVVPAGVFVVAPTADLVGIWDDKSITALARPFPEAYIGGTPAEFPDRYARASPLNYLRADLPPTYILTGANDHVVFPNRVTTVADRIVAAGAECTLVVAPFADHGFDGIANGYGNQLEEVLLPRFIRAVTA